MNNIDTKVNKPFLRFRTNNKHPERFSQLEPLYELLDATFRSNAAGKQVNLFMEAPSGACKTTVLKQYEELTGLKIKEGNTSYYEYLMQTIKFKTAGIHTLVHEDISKIIPEKQRLLDIGYWHMFLDHHVVNEQYSPKLDEYIYAGLILTAPTGNIDGKTRQAMETSGVMNRLLHIRFDSHRDVRRMVSMAIRHNNVHKTFIDARPETCDIDLSEAYEDEVFDLGLSGHQSTYILNLIEYGCDLKTIKLFLKGDLVLM